MHPVRKQLLFSLLVFVLGISAMPSTAAIRDEGSIGSTIQLFERGTMIWRADTGNIYALADDGRAWIFAPIAYGRLPLHTAYGQSPAGYTYSTNGFLRVWANYSEVRDALGWGRGSESGFLMTVVRDTVSGQQFLQQSSRFIYQINTDGTWEFASDLPDTDSELQLPISLDTFDVTPRRAQPGDVLTITWEVYGPAEGIVVELNQAVDPLSIAPIFSIYDPGEAFASVQIPVWLEGDARVTVSTITFDGDPYQYHGSLDLIVDIQPAEEVQVIYAAYQRYEAGFMLWRADTGAVYVGYNDGRIDRFAFYAGYDATPNDLTVPINRYLPLNAFGKIWWTGDLVRARLGWPTTPETGFDMTIRSLGQRSQTFSLPDGGRIQIDETTRGLTWRNA